MIIESKLKAICLATLTVALLITGFFFDAIKHQAKAAVEQPAIAFAARLIGDEKRSRLIVDFDRKIEHDVYLIDDPKRIVIGLPETIFSLPKGVRALPKSLVGLLRYGTTSPGQSRMVLELNRAARIEKSRVKPLVDQGRYRLILDIVEETEENFASLVRKEANQETGNAGRTNTKRLFKVVLDPGHGGIDGGAAGKKRTSEKSITLNFALKLRDALEKQKNYVVILTRDQDKFVSLGARLGIARETKADLFISIHADSLAQSRIRGATVYTLNENGSDAISRALARKQNRADLVAGLSLPQTKPSVTDILIDLTRRETEEFSVRFARLMVAKFKNNILLIGNPHRSADFHVLKAPEVPSVLLELGYLSNAEDEALMQSPRWQEKAVSKTVEAVNAFFSQRLVK